MEGFLKIQIEKSITMSEILKKNVHNQLRRISNAVIAS